MLTLSSEGLFLGGIPTIFLRALMGCEGRVMTQNGPSRLAW
jgi:hypothetical protein